MYIPFMPQIFISPDVPGIVLGTGNIPMSKKDNNPYPNVTYILVEQASNRMGTVITGIFWKTKCYHKGE